MTENKSFGEWFLMKSKNIVNISFLVGTMWIGTFLVFELIYKKDIYLILATRGFFCFIIATIFIFLNKSNIKIYKRFVYIMLVCTAIWVVFLIILQMNYSIPVKLYLLHGVIIGLTIVVALYATVLFSKKSPTNTPCQ